VFISFTLSHPSRYKKHNYQTLKPSNVLLKRAKAIWAAYIPPLMKAVSSHLQLMSTISQSEPCKSWLAGVGGYCWTEAICW